MNRKVLGAILAVWGVLVILYSLTSGSKGSGAYGAGQMAGTVVAVGLLIAGVVLLVTPGSSGDGDDEAHPRRKPRRKKRIRREE